jgi:hypothetical protein
MPTATITWHTQHDDNVCPICKAIDGYVWTFEGEVPDSLVHPQYGEIWNKQIGSLAHEIQQHKGSKYGLISSCRCHVEGHIVSLKDLLDLCKKKRDEIKIAVGGDVTE